ncbi:MAG TPA: fused response regulator/phosphatase, partial [Nitrospiraceae bacterium]|nr:fused response regulator/phosphatase [Nitrospiraceae bacterium]
MNQPAKVLIVDDEELIRLNLRMLLEDLGYSVIEAANGREGLDAFDREVPDLILADLRMPVMDGLSMI